MDAGTLDVGVGTEETPPSTFTAHAIFATGGERASFEPLPAENVVRPDDEATAELRWDVTEYGDDAACAAATPVVVLAEPAPVTP